MDKTQEVEAKGSIFRESVFGHYTQLNRIHRPPSLPRRDWPQSGAVNITDYRAIIGAEARSRMRFVAPYAPALNETLPPLFPVSIPQKRFAQGRNTPPPTQKQRLLPCLAPPHRSPSSHSNLRTHSLSKHSFFHLVAGQLAKIVSLRTAILWTAAPFVLLASLYFIRPISLSDLRTLVFFESAPSSKKNSNMTLTDSFNPASWRTKLNALPTGGRIPAFFFAHGCTFPRPSNVPPNNLPQTSILCRG